MRILVSGGCGVLGQQLAEQLAQQGHTLRILAMPNDPNVAQVLDRPYEIFFGDVTDRKSLEAATAGCQVVYHLAAILKADRPEDFHRINAVGTENMVWAAKGAQVQHFILVSSISVTYPEFSHYAKSKWEAEQIVLKSELPGFTLVRPTLVYDDRGGGSEFATLVRYVASYRWLFLPGGGKVLKNPVHVEDAVRGLSMILNNPLAFGKTFALAGGEVLSLHQMIIRIQEVMGWSRNKIGVPNLIGKMGIKLWGLMRPNSTWILQAWLGWIHAAAPDVEEMKTLFGYSPRKFVLSRLALLQALGRK